MFWTRYDRLKSPSSVRLCDLLRVTGCWLSEWEHPLRLTTAVRLRQQSMVRVKQTTARCGCLCVIPDHVTAACACVSVCSGWSQTANIALSVFNSASRQPVSDREKRCSLWLFWSKHNRRGEEGGGEEEENEECAYVSVWGWRGEGLIISAISKNRGLGRRKKKNSSAKNHSSIAAIWMMCAPWGGAWES